MYAKFLGNENVLKISCWISTINYLWCTFLKLGSNDSNQGKNKIVFGNKIYIIYDIRNAECVLQHKITGIYLENDDPNVGVCPLCQQ